MKGKDLSIAIRIGGLEALPAKPVDLLVALGGRVANLWNTLLIIHTLTIPSFSFINIDISTVQQQLADLFLALFTDHSLRFSLE